MLTRRNFLQSIGAAAALTAVPALATVPPPHWTTSPCLDARMDYAAKLIQNRLKYSALRVWSKCHNIQDDDLATFPRNTGQPARIFCGFNRPPATISEGESLLCPTVELVQYLPGLSDVDIEQAGKHLMEQEYQIIPFLFSNGDKDSFPVVSMDADWDEDGYTPFFQDIINVAFRARPNGLNVKVLRIRGRHPSLSDFIAVEELSACVM